MMGATYMHDETVHSKYVVRLVLEHIAVET